MIPSGAEYLLALRARRMSVPSVIVRLDAAAPLYVPSWWLNRGYSAGDWWLYWPEILVAKSQPIFRLDLRALVGMTVTLVQHGESESRMNQLIDRLFVCGAEMVHAIVGDSVTVLSDGGKRIAA